MKLLISALAAAAAVIAVPAAAQSIVSDDFTSGYGVFTPTAGAPIDLATGSPSYTACCSATGSAANLSNQFVTFGGGNRQNFGFLSTTFNTVAGQTYKLSFDYLVLGGGSETLNYSVGELLGNVSGSANNNFDTNYTPFTTTFTGTGSPTTLSFFATDAGTNVDVGVDNVSVTGAVPEPATWAMMMVGFGMIGFSLRRRSKVTTSVRFA